MGRGDTEARPLLPSGAMTTNTPAPQAESPADDLLIRKHRKRGNVMTVLAILSGLYACATLITALPHQRMLAIAACLFMVFLSPLRHLANWDQLDADMKPAALISGGLLGLATTVFAYLASPVLGLALLVYLVHRLFAAEGRGSFVAAEALEHKDCGPACRVR